MEQTTVGGGSDRGGGNCQLLSEMKQEPLQLRQGTLQEAVKSPESPTGSPRGSDTGRVTW